MELAGNMAVARSTEGAAVEAAAGRSMAGGCNTRSRRHHRNRDSPHNRRSSIPSPGPSRHSSQQVHPANASSSKTGRRSRSRNHNPPTEP